MKIFGRDFSDQVSIEADHAWMERMVQEMQLHLPRMLRDNPERSEFWNWFCGEAESLFRHARNDEERLYFQDFVNKTLEDAGLEERFELTRHADDPAWAEECPPPTTGDRGPVHH
jgi:hypothetical protein